MAPLLYLSGKPTNRELEPIALSGLADTASVKPTTCSIHLNWLFLCFLFIFKMMISYGSRATLAPRLL